ncbi:hypothetical protein [Roseomonas rosulenta]|uniref:hypothetical protein n=1 Tax=Roseomonas rosulenta TaxID=2748667 RepID=UPI0018E0189C|nr:hypothetical protein [Roseomonas rosulenta]
MNAMLGPRPHEAIATGPLQGSLGSRRGKVKRGGAPVQAGRVKGRDTAPKTPIAPAPVRVA